MRSDVSPSLDTAPMAPETSGPETRADIAPPPPLALPDGDRDGVPDQAHIAPNDPNVPGVVAQNRVYACTEEELWSLVPKTYVLDVEAFFEWPANGTIHRMTGLAIDQWGILYGVSFSGLYTCHPATDVCSPLAEPPLALKALTLVPASDLGEASDMLVGIKAAGSGDDSTS